MKGGREVKKLAIHFNVLASLFLSHFTLVQSFCVVLLQLSNTSHPSSSLLPLQRPKQSLLSHSFLFSFSSFPSPSYSRQISFPCPSSSSVILYPIVVTLAVRHQLLLLRFHPCSSSSSSSTSLHGEHQEAGEGGVFPSSH